MRTDEAAKGTRQALVGMLGLWSMAKPRIGLWVLIATASGFVMARGGEISPGRFCAALLGTALVTSSAAVINQLLEHHKDGLMARTRRRPLPSRGISPRTALIFGAGLAAGGMAVLILWTTAATAVLAASALILYLAAYTPLKQHTPACAAIGSVAGALPPAIGWAANDGTFGLRACLLFGLLFLWQMPHLLAIGWLHRDEYAAAGYALWGQRDECGRKTAGRAFVFTLLLAAVAQGAAVDYTAGLAGGLAMLLLNGALTGCAFRFLHRPSRESARGLFLATLAYLPLSLGVLVWLACGSSGE